MRRDKAFSHREAVQDMKPLEAVDYLLEVIEGHELDNPLDRIAAIQFHGFRPQEAIVLMELLRGEGKICRHDHLYEAMCRGRLPQDWPDMHIIHVHVCRIRQKLPAGFSILNVRGAGFCLTREGAALLPWEGATNG